MTMFSPAAGYHAAVRQELEQFGRILALQRVMAWSVRGVVVGLVLDLAVLTWAWTREATASLPSVLLVIPPLLLAVLCGLATSLVRQTTTALAHRVDATARLQERSVTALELGSKGEEHPLALAQMRDAVEHLKRVDAFEAFPLRAPATELIAALLLVLLSAALWFAPNPWAIRARATNPAIAAAREQAQKVERLADSLQSTSTPEIEALRDMLRKGAATIDTRSEDPEAALGSLEDLEARVRQMSAGDDQLASALAAVANALAGNPSTNDLAQAINTGDLRDVSRAARALAQQTEQMTPEQRAQTAQTLRDAANRAGRSSPQLQSQLDDAANALASPSSSQQGQSGSNSAQQGQSSQSAGQQGQGASRSPGEALNDLSNSAASAAERQRAQNQLQNSRNALERSLGRTQSRSGSGSQSSSSRSNSSSSQRGASDGTDGSAADGQSQGGQPGNEGSQQGSGQGGQEGQGGQDGQGSQPGSGYGTGSSGQQLGGGVSNLDAITRPESVGSPNGFSPDMTSDNPNLGEAGDGTARAQDEQVSPTFAQRTTQGGDGSSIPLGLRDLVKDYFSSLDQK